MAIREIAKETKKTAQNQKTENRAQAYKPPISTQFTPSQVNYGVKTSANPQHGSIIKNIASQSSANSQAGGNTTWEECRHLKKSTPGKEYCSEYHSLCAKENCKRARK